MENPIIASFLQSGPFGKGILTILLLISIFIWTVIQNKYFLFRKIGQGTKHFFQEYRKIGENIFQPIENEELFEGLPIYDIFACAKMELTQIMEEERGIDSSDVDAISAQLARSVAESKMILEEGITYLATATSISPFLGLLGTVWGVMTAFHGMGKLGNASISAVAPGLSEALVTTAVGLMVAIPAAMAYNYARQKMAKEIAVLNMFSLEIIGNIEKKFVAKRKNR